MMEFIGKEQDQAIWNMHYIQVKSNIVQPKRSHEVNVSTRKGTSYSYKYADLSDVDKAVMDACRMVKDKDGNVTFGYFFDIENGTDGISVQTIMVDSAGGMMKSDKVWFKNNFIGDAQQTAGLISYAKRYSLSAAFGIASEEDDDAQNLKPTRNKPAVRILDENELNHYEVSVFGNKHLLVDIWKDYLENKDGDTRKWLTSQKDPQTNQAIKQLLDQYNLKQRISEIEDDAEDNQPKEQVAQDKPKQAGKTPNNGDDDIKQLVDGDNENKAVSDAEFDAMNLF